MAFSCAAPAPLHQGADYRQAIEALYAVKSLWTPIGMTEDDQPQPCACCQRRDRTVSAVVLTLSWAAVLSLAVFIGLEALRGR